MVLFTIQMGPCADLRRSMPQTCIGACLHKQTEPHEDAEFLLLRGSQPNIIIASQKISCHVKEFSDDNRDTLQLWLSTLRKYSGLRTVSCSVYFRDICYTEQVFFARYLQLLTRREPLPRWKPLPIPRHESKRGYVSVTKSRSCGNREETPSSQSKDSNPIDQESGAGRFQVARGITYHDDGRN